MNLLDAPFFIESPPEAAEGVDYLGLRETNLALMVSTIPGVNNAIERVRCFSLLAWTVWRAWRGRLAWDRDELRGIWRLGRENWLGINLQHLLDQFDDFWVGTVLGNAPLGFYAVAYSFAEYPRRVVSDPIQHVVLATLARVQKDRLRLSQVTFRASAYLVRVGAFAATVFALVAPEFVAVLIGEQWLPAVPAFQLLVLFAMSLPLVAVALNVLVATGESRRVLQVRLVQLAVFVPAVVLGVWRWGIVGAALAEDLMVLVGLAVLLQMVRRHVDLSVARLLAAPLVAIAVAVGAVALLRDLLAQAGDQAGLAAHLVRRLDGSHHVKTDAKLPGAHRPTA